MSSNAIGSSEALVNTTTAGSQQDSVVTYLADGGWVVAWQTQTTGVNTTGISLQRYDSDGDAVDGEVSVTGSASSVRDFAIAGLDDGGWVVTYDGADSGGTIDNYGIYQVRFGNDGLVVTSETLVNTYVANIQDEPSVARLPDGGWVVIWSSKNQVSGSSGDDVYQQRFDSSGNAVGGETLVNTTTAGSQVDTDITALNGGGWVVTWHTGDDIFQQRFDSTGNANGGEVTVYAPSSASLSEIHSAALSDGGWVVSWRDDRYDRLIYQQRYDISGHAVGSVVQVSTSDAHLEYSDITGLADGGWVVTWASAQDGSGYGIYQQRYDADGNKAGDETLVNETTNSNQTNPSVTALSDGSWIVTWDGNGPGDSSGVYQRIFTPFVAGTTGDDVLSGTSDPDIISGYEGTDLIGGGDGADEIDGGAGDDFIRGDAGDDTIDGGADTDTAIYSGNWSDYTITESGGTYTIIDNRSGSPDGTDTVTNVEFFAFADGTINVSELLNVAPSAIEASALKIDENSAAGTEVATLTGTDGNSLDSFTFAITSDPSGFFEIVGDKLQVKSGAMLDYESARFHKVTIEVSDAAGATHSEKLRIDVTDLAEKIVLTTGDDVFKDKGTTETSIKAGRGNDQVTGSNRADTIDGGNGKDLIDGRGGADNISGGKGRDTITGGKGDDTFVFKTGWGKDTIVDFDAKGTHHDQIDVSGLGSIKSWNDLQHHHLSTKGSDVIIDGLNGDVLVLKNVNANHLDSSDFIF